MMENAIIEISNLHKSFGSVNAVQNLSFKVKKGELFVGENADGSIHKFDTLEEAFHTRPPPGAAGTSGLVTL